MSLCKFSVRPAHRRIERGGRGGNKIFLTLKFVICIALKIIEIVAT